MATAPSGSRDHRGWRHRRVVAGDPVDFHATALIDLRTHLLRAGALTDVPLEVVRAWDGQANASSTGGAILEATYIELTRALVTRLGREYAEIALGAGLGAVIGGSSFHYRLQGRIVEVLVRPRQPWFDSIEDRDRMLRAAASRAITWLTSDLGADVRGWTWGGLHRITYGHVLARVPVAGRVLSRGPFAYGGDSNTVCQEASTSALATCRSAAFRLPTGRSSTSRTSTARPLRCRGQPGIPGHPRYDDALPDFLAGRHRPLPTRRRRWSAMPSIAWCLSPPRSHEHERPRRAAGRVPRADPA
ncbi:MAG: penicillin acylase family protein [Dehalococcoidia bacterium]